MGRSKKRAGKTLRREDDRQEHLLASFLGELATVLLPQGVTPSKFNYLATRAFIETAAQLSVMRTGRPNQSRIAALTGVRRGEVRRYLRSFQSKLDFPDQYRAPIERVIETWSEDRRYTDKKGRPKRLNINGEPPSFAHLV